MVNEFVDYIARDDLEAAARWSSELISKTDILQNNPRLGRGVTEFSEESFRELLVGNYRIAYRLIEETIYIEAVWHTSQIPPHNDK